MVSGSWEGFHVPSLKVMIPKAGTMCPFKVEESNHGHCSLGVLPGISLGNVIAEQSSRL